MDQNHEWNRVKVMMSGGWPAIKMNCMKEILVRSMREPHYPLLSTLPLMFLIKSPALPLLPWFRWQVWRFEISWIVAMAYNFLKLCFCFKVLPAMFVPTKWYNHCCRRYTLSDFYFRFVGLITFFKRVFKDFQGYLQQWRMKFESTLVRCSRPTKHIPTNEIL